SPARRGGAAAHAGRDPVLHRPPQAGRGPGLLARLKAAPGHAGPPGPAPGVRPRIGTEPPAPASTEEDSRRAPTTAKTSVGKRQAAGFCRRRALRRRLHQMTPPMTASTAANGATAPTIVSSQLTVTRSACHPPTMPPARPGGGAALAAGLAGAFGPTRVSVTVAYAVSWLSAFCCASIDSRSDSCELIWFCTDSSELTSPACLSRDRSWAIAAWSEATLLPTSATCWVTSCACCDSESWVPSPPPDSAASVV